MGASRDLSHAVLESTDHNLAGTADEGQDENASHALYEWTEGKVGLVSLDPAGSPFKCGALLGQSQPVNSGR